MDRFYKFCFMLVYVVLSCLFLVGRERADLLAIVCVFSLCLFPKCFLVQIRIKARLAP